MIHTKNLLTSSAVVIVALSCLLPAQTCVAEDFQRDQSVRSGSVVSEDDRIIMAIRREVLADMKLSPEAKNIRIVREPEGITLFGSVATDRERKEIEAKAKGRAADKVAIVNRLEVQAG